jgi:hypothetical protein
MIKIKILHTICNLIFPLKCCFGVSDGISGKYLPMWVSFLVLDPNQDSAFGRRLAHWFFEKMRYKGTVSLAFSFGFI